MEYLCGIAVIQTLCRADTGVPFGVMLAFSWGDKKLMCMLHEGCEGVT